MYSSVDHNSHSNYTAFCKLCTHNSTNFVSKIVGLYGERLDAKREEKVMASKEELGNRMDRTAGPTRE
ncbi:hypothetical protein CGZ75_16105 [Paenibacillus herberti]|uniref:Uncharacterized protein n=1 Tax=Paenibacillus herberti TaxID=1619309 RepID=A0A229NXG3_9BACL|nr:hypothetical protein CGZ75_16105 [Paenibacillus herberti]